jgi:hypothetical protein
MPVDVSDQRLRAAEGGGQFEGLSLEHLPKKWD